MLNKRLKKTIASSLAIITIAIPIGNTASALEVSNFASSLGVISNTICEVGNSEESTNIVEATDIKDESIEELLRELENEGFDTEGFISDVNNTSFNELTTTEYNQILRERGVGSKAVKTAAKWLKKNISKFCKLINKYLGIKIAGSTLIQYIDVFVGVSDSIDNLIYRIVRKVAPKSWKNSTCTKWAKVIRLALPI